MRTVFAMCLALVLCATVWAQGSRPADLQLKAALHKEQVEGDLKGAIRAYEEVVRRYPGERSVAAKALLGMAACYEKLGQAEARKTYERILREYSDQTSVIAEARTRLGALGQGTAPRNGEVATRLLWDKATDTWGTTSADGRWLTFPDWETGDLGLRDLVSGQNRRVTNKGGYARAKGEVEGSAISADGKLIAFTWQRWDTAAEQEGRLQIRLIGADGRGERVLFTGKNLLEAEPQSWSPDGKWIAARVVYLDRSGGQIQLLSPDGAGSRIAVALRDRAPNGIRFSPDGKWLGYTALAMPGSLSAAQRPSVYVIAANGTAGEPVEVAANAMMGGWTPDGRALLIGRERNSLIEFYRLPLENGRASGEVVKLHSFPEVTPAGYIGAALGVTSKGSLIYSRTRRSTDAVLTSVDPASGSIGPLEAVMPIAAFGLGGMSGGVRFSPDGKQVLYTTTPKTILFRSLGGGPEHTLIPQMERVGRVEWASDSGSLIISGSTAGGAEGVYRVDLRSGAATLLFSQPRVFLLAPAPDGRTLYYRRERGPLVARDLTTGSERVVFETPETAVFDLKLSADGKTLALVALNRMRFVNVETGETQVRFEHEKDSHNKFWGGAWTPDGRYFLTSVSFGPSGNGPTELWSLPVAGGPPIRMKLPAAFRGVWISPDGRQLAMMRWENILQVWAAENILSPGL